MVVMLAGTIALITGHSYVALANKFQESGGAFTYFREIRRRRPRPAVS